MIDYTKEKNQNEIIIRLKSNLNFENTVYLRGLLKSLLKEKKLFVTLDLKKVSFLSSYAIGIFITLNYDFKKLGGEIKFINPTSHVKKIFDCINLDKVINISK